MPGEIPTSPTTAPPVQVTAVPPRIAKLADAPSGAWADAEEMPPISAAAVSKHVERYFWRLFKEFMFVPKSCLKEFSKFRLRVAVNATIALSRGKFCPVADLFAIKTADAAARRARVYSRVVRRGRESLFYPSAP